MNWTEYRKTPLVEMAKRTYRTRIPMRNGNIEVPVGTVVKITHKHSGLTLRSEPCECCGVKVFITHVQPQNIEEITE